MPATDAKAFFQDESYQDALIGLLCRDVSALRRCASLLKGSDFKPVPGMRNGDARWIIAEQALDYFHKYHEPIGNLLRSTVLDYANSIGMSDRQLHPILEYEKRLRAAKLNGSSSITEKIIKYKRQRIKAAAVQELSELQSTGSLTDEKWREITNKALVNPEEDNATVDYFETMQARIDRRRIQSRTVRAPYFLIDPLDSLVRGVGPGELGLVLGPFKRGKSMFLLWLAAVFALQRLNVLYITLEDPLHAVEDRLDSIITNIPFHSLRDKPKTVEQRFRRYKMYIRTKLKLRDGTHSVWTTTRIDNLVQQEREVGFFPDALIIDYDAKIVATKTFKEKRFESDATYTELEQIGARSHMIVWTGAQTQRGTENLKILSADRLAEDINKARNVSMAVSLGKGDWGEEGIYLWVAARRFDRQHVGANIISDKSRSLIYDRDATRKKQQEEDAEKDDDV